VFGRRKASQSSAHGVLGEAKPRPKRIELLFFAFIGEKSEGSPPLNFPRKHLFAGKPMTGSRAIRSYPHKEKKDEI
jgi:hypothetical protein